MVIVVVVVVSAGKSSKGRKKKRKGRGSERKGLIPHNRSSKSIITILHQDTFLDTLLFHFVHPIVLFIFFMDPAAKNLFELGFLLLLGGGLGFVGKSFEDGG